MKSRQGFVSNSSSCSYIVDFGKDIHSAEDLKEVLNEWFWAEYLSTDWGKDYLRWYSNTPKNMPFEKVCEFLFRVLSDTREDMDRSGKHVFDMTYGDPEERRREIREAGGDYEPEVYPDEPVPYEKFREEFLNDPKNEFDRELLKEGDARDRYLVENTIMSEWADLASHIKTKKEYKALMEIFREHPDRVGFFSFGNESSYFWDNKTQKDIEDELDPDEYRIIVDLRNFGIAKYLFEKLDYTQRDYS